MKNRENKKTFLKTPVIWGAILVLLVAGCSSAPKTTFTPFRSLSSPISTTLPPPFKTPRDMYHVVGPSETLWRISQIYNVDMNTLMRVNQLSDATILKNGQELYIPNTYGPRPSIPLYPTTRWTHIVVHHTATDVGNAFKIDQMHHSRGWENGMGYHFLIDNGTGGKIIGQIEIGPRWLKQMNGAHVKESNWNQKSIGISLVGNFSEDDVPPKMLDSLVFLVAKLMNFYQIPDRNIIGHRDVPGAATECPGNYFPWNEFKRRLRAY